MAIIVHGGAKEISPEEQAAHCKGCASAAQTGWEVLQSGGSALDAVTRAIQVLEDDPTFNAGTGSALNRNGQVGMDAGLMEGGELRAGAVANITGVRNPILAARKLVEEDTCLLVGDPARQFARDRGVELCDPAVLITDKQRHQWEEERKQQRAAPQHDTVGCVAVDSEGRVAAGASTGGLGNHDPGRVGDSPLPGCGFYADNPVGGTSMTGDGEAVMRTALARRVIGYLEDGCPPEQACQGALDLLRERTGAEAGCITIDREGRIGWSHNSSHMACAYMSEGMVKPAAFVKKDEERAEQEAPQREGIRRAA